jgi:hypothetical protein
MSASTQLLLIQIMQIGAMLAADGTYQVFVQTRGHTSRISVEIYPRGSDWSQVPDHRPLQIACADVRWEPYCPQHEDEQRYTQQLLRCQRELEFMRAALHAYLPNYPAERQEAA